MTRYKIIVTETNGDIFQINNLIYRWPEAVKRFKEIVNMNNLNIKYIVMYVYKPVVGWVFLLADEKYNNDYNFLFQPFFKCANILK